MASPNITKGDLKNEKWFTFACSYRYEGSEWCLNVVAKDREDAEARLRAIALGRVDGLLDCEIYVPLPPSTPRPILGAIGRLLVQVRRLLAH